MEKEEKFQYEFEYALDSKDLVDFSVEFKKLSKSFKLMKFLLEFSIIVALAVGIIAIFKIIDNQKVVLISVTGIYVLYFILNRVRRVYAGKIRDKGAAVIDEKLGDKSDGFDINQVIVDNDGIHCVTAKGNNFYD